MALSQPRADACQLAGKAEGVPEAGRQSSLGAPTAAGEGSRRGSYHHARASAMYDRLVRSYPAEVKIWHLMKVVGHLQTISATPTCLATKCVFGSNLNLLLCIKAWILQHYVNIAHLQLPFHLA